MTTNVSKDSVVEIPGPEGVLEAVVTVPEKSGELAAGGYVAVICHPHPQHGGTMNHKVVTTLMRTYRDLGVTVVRFNFRGVGKSTGNFDQGVGEVEDLRAVVRWVVEQFPAASLLLAGFSFGSAIAAQVSYSCENLRHLLLVAPPVERYTYDRDGFFNSPACVIQGDKDERVFADGVYVWVETLQSPVDLIRYTEAGHFFHGYLVKMRVDLERILVTRLLPLAS
jgi:hypothetical protein